MIAFVPVLELARVVICNLHVIESYHPEWLNLSDLWCLVVARWGLIASMAATRWLLAAIAIHMYLLCVKLRSHINTTKNSITICALILICSILVGAVSTISNIYFSSSNGKANSNVTGTALEHKLPTFQAHQAMSNTDMLRDDNETKNWASQTQMNPPKDANPLNVTMCRGRKDIMLFAKNINEVVFIVNIVLPLLIQIYFYSQINEHLNEERRRFQNNRQVVNRLERNNRAVLRTLLASFICHFVFFLPLIVVTYFKLSHELELLTRVVTLNSSTGGAICFLFLHGGFR